MKYIILALLLSTAAMADDYDAGYNNPYAFGCSGASSYCQGVNDSLDDEDAEYKDTISYASGEDGSDK